MARLIILGSGDAFNSGGRFQTAFLLLGNQQQVLIDCGSSTLRHLKEKGISPNEIDAIVISHFHGDHIGGLPFLLLDMAGRKRKKPLHIFSPAGGKRMAYRGLCLFYPGNETILETLPIEWHEYEEGKKLDAPGIEVQGFTVKHTPEVNPHGVGITINDKIMAYSGDTAWTDNLIPLSKDADLFICDCTFFDTENDNHLNYKTLMAKKDLLQYKRLLLTHFDEEMLVHQNEVEIEMARDGEEVEV